MTASRRSVGLALAAVVGVLGAMPSNAIAGPPPDFPPDDALFHTYAEMVDDIHAAEDAHPGIVELFSIGQSYEGRELWAAKVSDNVTVDEPEPEVLFVAAHHGDEHLSTEQALYLFHVLADDYGVDTEVTRLVNRRETWFVFMLNPDGATFDLTGDPYQGWRKNRQPNGDGLPVGTDLNRNYDYQWGCCGGSSGKRGSNVYRGPRPFSAPESKALADFVDSRVLDGQQQIRTHITLHASGEFINYPYAYTTADVPGDMTSVDHDTFVALARAMAATNGYKVQQSSSWYIADGDEEDWMYGRHRIFAFTLELYPPAGSTGLGGHHPPDDVIAAETARNREALLYVMDLAACPYRASGTQVANCGVLYDDLELDHGWTVDPLGTDTAHTASAGAWARGDPSATSSNGPKQLGKAVSGSHAFITGLAAGLSSTGYDLDGRTSVTSRDITLPGDPDAFGALTFSWYLSHSAGSTSADSFRVYVVDTATGARTRVFERLGKAADVDAAWKPASVSLAPFAGRTIRLLFVAADASPHNLVEAGFDDVRIQRPG